MNSQLVVARIVVRLELSPKEHGGGRKAISYLFPTERMLTHQVARRCANRTTGRAC